LVPEHDTGRGDCPGQLRLRVSLHGRRRQRGGRQSVQRAYQGQRRHYGDRPTGRRRCPVGSSLTARWTTSAATSSGESGVWARSTAGSWYLGKLVPARGGSSFSSALTLRVPAGGGYQAIVGYRSTVASGAWGSFGTQTGSFGVTRSRTSTLPSAQSRRHVGTGHAEAQNPAVRNERLKAPPCCARHCRPGC